MYGPACVFSCATLEFHITLLRRISNDLFSLCKRQRMIKSIAVSCTHIIHTNSCNGFQAGIDFSGADSKTAAAADPDRANLFSIGKRPCTQVIYRRAEGFSIKLRRNGIAWLAVTAAPKRQIDRHSYKTAFCHLNSVKISALLFYCPHRMPYYDSSMFFTFVHIFRQIQITGNIHLVLIFKSDFLDLHLITPVKIISISRPVGSKHSACTSRR